MIKPKNRKRAGITALITNNVALFIAMYLGQSEVAQTSIYVNAIVIIAWYTSEGFVEYLISKQVDKTGNKEGN